MSDVTVSAEQMQGGDHLFLTDQYMIVQDVQRLGARRVQVRVQALTPVPGWTVTQMILYYDLGEPVIVRRAPNGPVTEAPKRARRTRAPQQKTKDDGG